MSKNLIQDCIIFEPQKVLHENFGGTRNDAFVVEGVLQRKNAANQNGRIYPGQILEREVKNYQSKIQEKRALGELDHPDSNVVNLKNVSHNIVSTRWQGDDLVGTVEILDTPSGKILKELFKAGITLGISSRGLGSIKQLDENTVEVQDDFELICWDFVSDPSTHGAFMKPSGNGVSENIIKESIDKEIETRYSIANKMITDIVCDISGVCCVKN